MQCTEHQAGQNQSMVGLKHTHKKNNVCKLCLSKSNIRNHKSKLVVNIHVNKVENKFAETGNVLDTQ